MIHLLNYHKILLYYNNLKFYLHFPISKSIPLIVSSCSLITSFIKPKNIPQTKKKQNRKKKSNISQIHKFEYLFAFGILKSGSFIPKDTLVGKTMGYIEIRWNKCCNFQKLDWNLQSC